jgi:hypothetical protein
LIAAATKTWGFEKVLYREQDNELAVLFRFQTFSKPPYDINTPNQSENGIRQKKATL